MIKVNPDYTPIADDLYFLVSGGVDSIAACHWLVKKYHRKVKVVHFNHNVQPINDKMSQKVWAFVTDHVDDMSGGFFKSREPSLEPAFNDTSENGLRAWRQYKMQGIGGNYITAHHLNDCVENYLSNCFSGNPEHLPISWSTDFGTHRVFHPFLKTTKQDFIDYAEENGLMQYVVEDPTNKDNQPKRNWIRNVIVPELNGRDLGIETIVRKKFYN